MEKLTTNKSLSRTNSLYNKVKNISENTIKNAKDTTEKVFYEIKTLEKSGEYNNLFFIIRYIFVFLIILIILINILHLLKILPDRIVNTLKPLLKFFGHKFDNTVKLNSETTMSNIKTNNNTSNIDVQNGINQIKEDVNKKEVNNNIPQPDDSIDSVNRARATHKDKLEYCYVGTDRGYRSCIDIEDQDKCLSGDIFPTMDICINPNLR